MEKAITPKIVIKASGLSASTKQQLVSDLTKPRHLMTLDERVDKMSKDSQGDVPDHIWHSHDSAALRTWLFEQIDKKGRKEREELAKTSKEVAVLASSCPLYECSQQSSSVSESEQPERYRLLDWLRAWLRFPSRAVVLKTCPLCSAAELKTSIPGPSPQHAG